MEMNIKFDLNDILIMPAVQSDIRNRGNIKHKYGEHLPLIAAPMDTVINSKNVTEFTSKGINVCLPRGVDIKEDDKCSSAMIFKSYGLEEFKTAFLLDEDDAPFIDVHNKYLLIDIANGHMEDLYNVIIKFKKKYKSTYKLMVGNVARPETYSRLSSAGADYIRIGIGNGNGCLTTQQTGIGYPMGSLIKECYAEKNTLSRNGKNCAKIVADGGMKDYSDIIKSLALGADYVMVGSILNKCLESSGQSTFLGIPIKQDSILLSLLWQYKFPIKKKFRGMASKEVQKKWGRTKLKTSEGIVTYRKVEYTVAGWTENFEHYLKSAMSYSNADTLELFTGLAQKIHITINSYKRFNK